MTYSTTMKPETPHKAQTMSLDEFLRKAGSADVNKLMTRITGGSYSGCHNCFYQATGIWIPELVPVFQKLDAMMALRGPVTPKELSR
ncbi:MAG: hypothetical protein V4510_10390 [bacterium]